MKEVNENQIKLEDLVNIQEGNKSKILTENFNKLDNTILKKEQLENAKMIFEDKYKDNEIFKAYKELLDQLEEANDEINKAKTYMYESMLDSNVDYLSGVGCEVTLKKPYTKRTFNSKQFYADYQQGSEMYNKYITESQVKGNVSIKVLEESK